MATTSSKFPLTTRALLLAAELLGPALILLLGRLTRFTIENQHYFDRARSEGKGVILTLWHGRMLLPIYHHRRTGVVSLVSLHRDGEFITRVVRRLGYAIHRGSPKEGGREGFQALLVDLKRGASAAMFPDGPTGPRHSIHDGILHLARLSGAPILPLTFSAKPCWRVKSWDRFMIMLPFSRAVIRYEAPICIPRSISNPEEMSRWRDLVRERLTAVEEAVDREMGMADE